MAHREGSRFLGVGLAIAALCVYLIALLVPTASAVEFGNIGGKTTQRDPNNPRTQSIFIKYAAPGETVEDAVQVVNYTGETKTLLVYAVDSIVSSGGSFGCAQLVDEKKAVGSWVKMSRTEVTLESNEEQIVPFTVTPPLTGADVGENDGCIVIQEKDAAPQSVGDENSSINLSFRTAIRLAVFLPGEVKKSIQILGYAASRSEDGNFILKPRVKNNGNVSLDATLNTYTRGVLGGKVDNYNQESPLLRGVTSDWNIPYKRPFWGGWVKSHFTVTYDANVSNSLGESTNPNLVTLQSETIYFFIPPKPLAFLLEIFALIAFAAGLYYLYLRFFGGGFKRRQGWKPIIIEEHTDIVSLAKQYGIAWRKLARKNRLKSPYVLRPGDTLMVPNREPDSQPQKRSRLPIGRRQDNEEWKVITIGSLVDLSTVARTYGISMRKLAKVNDLKPPYILKPGDDIKIPASSQPHVGRRPQAKASPAELLERIPYFHYRKLRREWDEITIPAQVDGVITHLDIESLARTYGVPWKLLAKINKLHPPYLLRPGDKIKVPPKKPKH